VQDEAVSDAHGKSFAEKKKNNRSSTTEDTEVHRENGALDARTERFCDREEGEEHRLKSVLQEKGD
jgi:hypothetical protein